MSGNGIQSIFVTSATATVDGDVSCVPKYEYIIAITITMVQGLFVD